MATFVEMPRNIEIKAKVDDVDDLKERIKSLGDANGEILNQVPVGFTLVVSFHRNQTLNLNTIKRKTLSLIRLMDV